MASINVLNVDIMEQRKENRKLQPWGVNGEFLVCKEGVYQWNAFNERYDFVDDYIMEPVK